MVTSNDLNEYAEAHGYSNWIEFRSDVDDFTAQEAVHQIELDKPVVEK